MRFVIEQYRDELMTSLQGSVDEARVAEDREAVASDLLNILHRSAIFFHSRDLFDQFTHVVLFQHSYPVHRNERSIIGVY